MREREREVGKSLKRERTNSTKYEKEKEDRTLYILIKTEAFVL